MSTRSPFPSPAVPALLLALALAAPGASEEPPATDPFLDALVAEALERSPDVAAAREEALAARARPDAASALPDPMASVLYTNDGWAPSLGEQQMTTLGFMWSQTLPWPGKRALRATAAERAADAADERVERARLEVAGAVRRAYAALLLARETLVVVGEREALARDVEGVARSRYAVGEGAQQDVIRAQVEVTRVEELREDQETEGAVRLAELNRLLARAPDAPLDTPARLAVVAETRPLEVVQAAAEARSPELRASDAALAGARAVADLAARAGQPDLSVRAGYMNRGGLDPMWQAGVGVSLPIWGKKNAAARGEADARVRAIESRREALRLQLRFRNQERLARLGATERIYRLYTDGILPQSRMSVDSALAGYRAGRVPFVSVLEAQSSLYTDQISRLSLMARHAQLRAALEEISLDASAVMALPSSAASAAGGISTASAMPE
jgi:cobalt-zinc-cadmium efflux system outer membrane protein